ncbi:MAG: hypothetical protein MJB14_09320 [Spirochaetes bacterium]|nr:hypothetical protein [Spirochaetota bacterium]
MKRFFIIIFLINLLNLAAEEINLAKITFEGVNLKKKKKTFQESESKSKFNIAFSSILPHDGIYRITDEVTGKEAIIQIGYYMTKTPPKTLYLPDYLFSFLANAYEKKIDKVSLKLQFLGWAKTESESDFLNIQSLVISPENAATKIVENGDNQYYIQLGSYEYYQNSFPKITEMLPFLEVRPNFYMMRYQMKKNNQDILVYRVLAGPYDKNIAKKLLKVIHSTRDKTVFMKSGKTILKEENP